MDIFDLVCLVLIRELVENLTRKEYPRNAQDTLARQNSLQFLDHSSLNLLYLAVVVLEFPEFWNKFSLLFPCFLLQFCFKLFVIWVLKVYQICELEIIFRIGRLFLSTSLDKCSQVKGNCHHSHAESLLFYIILIRNHFMKLIFILLNDFVSTVVECLIAALLIYFGRIVISMR